MNRRQTFLALAATLLPLERALGGPFRRRRCVPSKVVQDVPKPKPAVAKTGDSFIQPDYGKWSRVKEGMTEAEVLDLLGKPLERDTEEEAIAFMRKEHNLTEAQAEAFIHTGGDRYGFVWLYGQIRYESPVIPYPYQFRLIFVQGRVVHKGDPFKGRLSPDGKPTTPIPILPSHGTLFKYSPRFVDMRWEPSSGEYPMEYEIEVSLGQHERIGGEGSIQLPRGRNAAHEAPAHFDPI